MQILPHKVGVEGVGGVGRLWFITTIYHNIRTAGSFAGKKKRGVTKVLATQGSSYILWFLQFVYSRMEVVNDSL